MKQKIIKRNSFKGIFMRILFKLKRNLFFKKIYKYIYRNILKNKFLYFFSNSTKPISSIYGFDRGKPLDRFYIENFLEKNKENIRGNCMELLNNNYTIKFGESKVIKSTILDIDKDNEKANLVSDIRDLNKTADGSFDCIILTQVLQFIDDIDAAISECYRVLKPGGIILCTLPAISRADCSSGVSGDYWRFTKASAMYLFEKKFVNKNLEIKSLGNAKSGIYFFAGLSLEDTSKKILMENDENFPLIITVKAIK